MNKLLKIYLGIFILLTGLVIYYEYTKPQPIDWTITYSTKDKNPFGAYILYKEMPKLFPEKNISLIKESPSSYLRNTGEYNETDFTLYEDDSTEEQEVKNINSVYFFISQDSNISEIDIEYLLDFVKSGNDVFIISNSIPRQIQDSLHIETNTPFITTDNVEMSLTNPVFKKEKYKFDKYNGIKYFNKVDSTQSTILGMCNINGSPYPNFIKQTYGKGNFYLHLFPEAFANYYMLNDENYKYVVNSINYINKDNILWDLHNMYEDSLLKHIKQNPALHWAWLILILGGCLYCIFFGKRIQRIIPIIKPLRNTTVEFTQTIGNIYFNNGEYKSIIDKKIKHFLYFIKENYFINTEIIDKDFADKLHLKSGVSETIINKITRFIKKHHDLKYNSEEDLKYINNLIDSFYKNTKYNGKF